MAKLTRAQRANLKKLATYLENLPEDYQHFEMSEFNSLSDADAVDYGLNNGGLDRFSEANACGTVACAVGHGPSAGVLFRKGKDYVTYDCYGEKFVDPKWNEYSERFAPLRSDEWNWMFGAEWSDYDNTHRGAAARIRYLLDGNTPPITTGRYFFEFDYEPDPVLGFAVEYAKYLVKGDDHIKAKAAA